MKRLCLAIGLAAAGDFRRIFRGRSFRGLRCGLAAGPVPWPHGLPRAPAVPRAQKWGITRKLETIESLYQKMADRAEGRRLGRLYRDAGKAAATTSSPSAA